MGDRRGARLGEGTRHPLRVGFGLAACTALVAVNAAAASAVSLTARPASSPEYEVKSAFLLNFAKFVEWPPAAAASAAREVKICVLGEDPFGEALDRTVSGKEIGNRPVAAVRVATASEAAGCAVLFVSASEAGHLDAVLAGLRGVPVLTVGDTRGFAGAGGIIGLFLENDRVRFEINVGAAHDAHLKISSQLLGLARIVGPRGERGR